MPADSESGGVPLPHTWRPLGVRLAAVIFGGALLVVCAMAWIGFDDEIRGLHINGHLRWNDSINSGLGRGSGEQPATTRLGEKLFRPLQASGKLPGFHIPEQNVHAAGGKPLGNG